jgi:hypothetical protein
LNSRTNAKPVRRNDERGTMNDERRILLRLAIDVPAMSTLPIKKEAGYSQNTASQK